jgi:hypothetical protein
MEFLKNKIIIRFFGLMLLSLVWFCFKQFKEDSLAVEYKELNFYGKIDSIYFGEKNSINIFLNGKWIFIIGNDWYSSNDNWHFLVDDIGKNDTIKKQKGYFLYLKKANQAKFKEYYCGY